MSTHTTVTVDGRTLQLSNLDKLMYPEAGLSKADVVDYYTRIAPLMLPHLAGRPITRKRWVDGVGTIEHPGEVFFVKALERGAPDWLARLPQQHLHRRADYPLADEPAALVWFAQMAALELHTPQWRFTALGKPAHPDRLVLDLDPGEGIGLAECAAVALNARERLEAHGLAPLPLTSGSKGVHLYARLDGSRTAKQVTELAHRVARELEAAAPDAVVSTMPKADRVGKVLIDWSQNSAAKTTVAPYSLRGRVRPGVAAPRSWEELRSPMLTQLGPAEVLDRVARDGDLLADLAWPIGSRA